MKYLYEDITLPDGTQNRIIMRSYDIRGLDHDGDAADMVKPIKRDGYERSMSASALLHECGYRRTVINPGAPHVDTRVSML